MYIEVDVYQSNAIYFTWLMVSKIMVLYVKVLKYIEIQVWSFINCYNAGLLLVILKQPIWYTLEAIVF